MCASFSSPRSLQPAGRRAAHGQASPGGRTLPGTRFDGNQAYRDATGNAGICAVAELSQTAARRPAIRSSGWRSVLRWLMHHDFRQSTSLSFRRPRGWNNSRIEPRSCRPRPAPTRGGRNRANPLWDKAPRCRAEIQPVRNDSENLRISVGLLFKSSSHPHTQTDKRRVFDAAVTPLPSTDPRYPTRG